MAQIIDFFNNFFGGAILAFILSNAMNFVELGLIAKMMKDMQTMMKQFKSEGEGDKWLK